MKILDVIKMGNPVLRESSKPVGDELRSSEFQNFIDDLVHTMRTYNGVGIAAPQVGVSKRIFSIEVANNPRYPGKEAFPLCIVINPEIEFLDTKLIDSWEGCLSIPKIRGKLKRREKVLLKGLDREGNPFEEQLQGFPAIIAQHELDHLDGKLFIDRMESMETLSFQSEYEKYWVD